MIYFHYWSASEVLVSFSEWIGMSVCICWKEGDNLEMWKFIYSHILGLSDYLPFAACINWWLCVLYLLTLVTQILSLTQVTNLK